MKKKLSQRLPLLLLASLALVSGCAGGQTATTGRDRTLSEGASGILPPADRLAATLAFNRWLLRLSPAALAQAIHATLPIGTRIYVVPAFDVMDGSNSYSMAGPIRKIQTSGAVTIIDRYNYVYHLSAAAKITPNAWGITEYFRPGNTIPADLANLPPTEVVGGTVR